MKKIAFVINYISNSGPGRVLMNIMSGLNKDEYRITLVTLFDGNDKQTVADLPSEVKLIELHDLKRFKCLLGNADSFFKLFTENAFDIVHSHGIIPDILVSRLNKNIKRVSTVHCNFFEDYPLTYGKIKGLFLAKYHKMTLRNFDMTVCCSESIYKAFVQRQKPKNVCYIRNGIETTAANTIINKVDVGLPKDSFVFIYSGVLNNRKNVYWLVKNFVRFHQGNEYLLVLGKGNQMDKCSKCADQNVIMLGFKNNVYEYLRLSDIYISASLSEGLSISILEALDNGLGLFLSDIPSHRELFEIDTSIYLGEIFSRKSFAEKLILLRQNADNINSEKIRSLMKENLSGYSMTEQYTKVYNNIMHSCD